MPIALYAFLAPYLVFHGFPFRCIDCCISSGLVFSAMYLVPSEYLGFVHVLCGSATKYAAGPASCAPRQHSWGVGFDCSAIFPCALLRAIRQQ